MEDLIATLTREASFLDAKVRALSSLSKLLAQTPDDAYDALTLSLKTTLRHANAQLVSATLDLLPSYLASIRASPSSPARSHNLKLLCAGMLPSPGGLLERMGDARGAIRDGAGKAMVELGVGCWEDARDTEKEREKEKDAGKEKDTALSMWERALKDSGLAGRSGKVKEKALAALLEVRARIPTFRLRQFLGELVELLEDSEGFVRDAAREAVIVLFSSAAPLGKSELKKAMLARGVRKSILDPIVAAVFSSTTGPAPPASTIPAPATSSAIPVQGHFGRPSGASTSEPALAPTASTPISALSTEQGSPTSAVDVVYVATARDLHEEFTAMSVPFEGKETEHNWLGREESCNRVRGLLKGGAFTSFPDAFIACLRSGWLEDTLKALGSLRTTLSASACLCYRDLSTVLGSAFDPFLDLLLPPLLRMAGFTKTVFVLATQTVVTTFLQHSSCLPRVFFPHLEMTAQDKTPRARSYAFQHVQTFLDVHAGSPASRSVIEAQGGLDALERLLRKGLGDPSPVVKEPTRVAFWTFERGWPAVAKKIADGLEPMAKKSLASVKPAEGRSSLAGSGAATEAPAPSALPKRSSLATQIAAQRRAKEAREKEEAAKLQQQQIRSPDLGASSSSASSYSSVRKASAAPASSYSSPDGLPPRGLDTPPSRIRSRSNASLSLSPTSRPLPSSPPFPQEAADMSSLMSFDEEPSLPAFPSPSPSPSPAPSLPSPSSSPSPSFSPSPLPTVSLPEERGQAESLLADVPALQGPIDDAAVDPEGEEEDSDSEEDRDQTIEIEARNLEEEEGASTPTASNERLSQEQSSGPSNDLLLLSDEDAMESATPASPVTVPPEAEPVSLIDWDSPPPSESAEIQPSQNQFDFPALPSSPPLFSPLTEQTPLSPVSVPFSAQAPLSPVSLPSRSAASPPRTPASQPTASSSSSAALFRAALAYKDSPAAPARPAFALASPSSPSSSSTNFPPPSPFWSRRLQALERALPPSTASSSSPVLPTSPPLSRSTIRDLLRLYSSVPASLDAEEAPTPPNGLLPLLFSQPQTREEADDALALLGALVERAHPSTFHGLESDLCAHLWNVRPVASPEASTSVLLSLIHHPSSSPPYLLAVLASTLRTLLAEPLPSGADDPQSDRSKAQAFALVGLARCLVLLPSEVVQDEIPRIRDLILPGLEAPELRVREAAAGVLLSAQAVVRDETLVFALLDGEGGSLSEERLNLLTYLFDKNRVTRGSGEGGRERVERELRRLSLR